MMNFKAMVAVEVKMEKSNETHIMCKMFLFQTKPDRILTKIGFLEIEKTTAIEIEDQKMISVFEAKKVNVSKIEMKKMKKSGWTENETFVNALF